MKSTQKKRNVHGQRKKFASPNARDTNMFVFLALGNATVLSYALGDAKDSTFALPNARNTSMLVPLALANFSRFTGRET